MHSSHVVMVYCKYRFYMCSCYTLCIVNTASQTILAMILLLKSWPNNKSLTALISMQYKIFHSCSEYFHSSFGQTHENALRNSGTHTCWHRNASIKVSISWPRQHQRRARRADLGRGWNKWWSFWTLFSQRTLSSWQRLPGNYKPWEWCIVSVMTCSLAVFAGRGVCQREVSLMKHRCVEEESGKGVGEVCLASPSVFATWLS